MLFIRQPEALTQISKANSLERVLEKMAAEALIDDGCSDQTVKPLMFHGAFLP